MTWETFVCTSQPGLTWPSRVQHLFLEDGPAAKRNFIAQMSHGSLLVFLDDDVEIRPDTLKACWDWMQAHPQCGMAFGKIYKMAEGRRDELDDCGSWLTWTGFLWARGGGERDRGAYEAPTRILASKSATCAITRTAFDRAGRFDPSYFILGEETDLAWRVWLSGGEVWCVPLIVSYHAFGCEELKPRADFYTIERTMTYGCRNYLSLLWTNLGVARLAVIFPAQLSAWLAASLGFLCRGDGRRAVAILRGLCQFVFRLPDLCRKRHCVQSTRRLSDRSLLAHVAYRPPIRYYLNRLWRYWTTQLHG